MPTGFVLLYRSLLEDPDWYREPFDKGKAWVDLLLRANYRNVEIDTKKKVVGVLPGQVFTSQRGLARDWKRNRRTINRWLNGWNMVGKIHHKTDRDKDHGYTLITINNWGKYQNPNGKTAPQSSHKVHTNNNKENKYNNELVSSNKFEGEAPRYLDDINPSISKVLTL